MAALRGLHEPLRQDLHGTGVRSCHVVFTEVAHPSTLALLRARSTRAPASRQLTRLTGRRR